MSGPVSEAAAALHRRTYDASYTASSSSCAAVRYPSARAKMLNRHAGSLSGVLNPSTLTDAAPRTEDSAAFMASLLETGRITAGSDSACTYFLSVAMAKPGGDVICGQFETTASDELPDEVADLLSDCMSVADSIG